MLQNKLPWFMQTNAKELLGNLTADSEIRKYIVDIIEQGYCIIPRSVSPDVLTACKNDFTDFKDTAVKHIEPSEAGKYRRLVNLHCLVPSLADLFCQNEKAQKVLEVLFGEPPTLYTSLFFEIGSAQDLHRDTPYFWTNPLYRYFGVWVPLEKVDEENGCLEVLAGSHLIPEEDRAEIGRMFYSDLKDVPASDPRLWVAYQEKVLGQGIALGLEKRSACMEAGDTIIWHPQTMHGGKQIVDTSRTRLSQAMHITPQNTPVYHNQAFFNPEYHMSLDGNWSYKSSNGIKYIDHQMISFEHKHDFTIDGYKALIEG